MSKIKAFIFIVSIFFAFSASGASDGVEVEILNEFNLPGYNSPASAAPLKKDLTKQKGAERAVESEYRAKVARTAYGMEVRLYRQDTWLRQLMLGPDVLRVTKVTATGGKYGLELKVEYEKTDDTAGVVPVTAMYSGGNLIGISMAE